MYCTLDDVKKDRIAEGKLIQLTDDNDLGVVDEEKVANAITGAGEVIDGFLRGRYPLPLNPVPGIIRTIALDITTYNIYGLKPEFGVPKTVSDRYTTSTKLLERIQDGKMELYEKTPPPAAGSTASGASVSGPARLFSRDSLKGY